MALRKPSASNRRNNGGTTANVKVEPEISMRIVSLLPAATEIVCHLGLRNQLVGVSHSCPLGHLPLLTRSRVPINLDALSTDQAVCELLARGEPLFDLDEKLLVELEPDVVLTQSLCNVCALDGNQLLQIAERLGPSVDWVQWAPTTLTDVIDGIALIGRHLGASVAGESAAATMKRDLTAKRDRASRCVDSPSVVFLEWLQPLFCAGHWIPELIEIAGGRELIGTAGARSRQIGPKELIAADPDIIIACCCGWPADRTAAAARDLQAFDWWRSLRAVKENRVHIVDAEMTFTTPGPNLVNACRELAVQLNARPALAVA